MSVMFVLVINYAYLIYYRISADLISEEAYWERCCRARWSLCDVSCYDNVWKKMFFERHTEELIEHYVPEKSDPKVVSYVDGSLA